MKKDLKIILDSRISAESCSVVSEALPEMLLQRLITLMLADSGGYREDSPDYALLKMLEGGNRPQDGIINAFLAICCAMAVRSLDDEDKAWVSAFRGISTEGNIECTLELVDGSTTTTGVL